MNITPEREPSLLDDSRDSLASVSSDSDSKDSGSSRSSWADGSFDGYSSQSPNSETRSLPSSPELAALSEPPLLHQHYLESNRDRRRLAPRLRHVDLKGCFTDFFATPSNRETLWEFMVSEYAEETMLFYQACQSYSASVDCLAAAKDIYSVYLQPGSVFQCQVPSAHQEKIQQEIEMGSPEPNLFDAVRGSILKQIQNDAFLRFASSDKGRAIFGVPKMYSISHSVNMRTVRNSEVVARSFVLASADPGFNNAFNNALRSSCPELALAFSVMGHPSVFIAVFTEVLNLLSSEKQFAASLRRFASCHLRAGVNIQMLEAFGIVLSSTVRSYLINLNGIEIATFDRHWGAVFELIARELAFAMTQLGPEHKRLFSSEPDFPRWLQHQLGEYNSCTAYTLSLVKKNSDRFVLSFFTRFLEATPASSEKFASVNKRAKCLLGALHAVVKLLKKPKSMRKHLTELASLHKGKGISREECVLFVQALLTTFDNELGGAFLSKTALVWKQYLELIIMFFAQIDGDKEVSQSVRSYGSVSDSENSNYLSPPSGYRGSETFNGEMNSFSSTREDDENFGPPIGARAPGSFWDVILTPSHLEALRQFASAEFKEENILFYIACTKFQEAGHSPEQLENAAMKIYALYLSPNALFPVNVNPRDAKDIMQCVGRQIVTTTLFERAKLSVLKTIEQETYTRFMSTSTGLSLRGIKDAPIVSRPSADPSKLIKESNLLRRSFQIATNSSLAFSEAFSLEFFTLSPESKLLFKRSAHQDTALVGVIGNLIAFLKASNERSMASILKSLSGVHFSFGVTRSMFENFGVALLSTLRKFLELPPDTLECEAVFRHWKVVYDVLSTEIMQGMLQPTSKSVFSKDEVAPVLTKQYPEFKSFATLSLVLLKRRNDAFIASIASKFFARSSASKKAFLAGSQEKCVWGALNSVVSILDQPKKVRQILVQVSKIHKGKGIGRREYCHFTQSIREACCESLDTQYTDKMDGVWKRGLELFELFMPDEGSVDSLLIENSPPNINMCSRGSFSFEPNRAISQEFELVLTHRLEELRTFAQDEHTEEHLMFYLACVKFAENAATQTQTDMLDAAQKIYSFYLAPTSLFNVGFPQGHVKQVLDAIDNQMIQPDSFSSSKEAVMKVLERDLFSRFCAPFQVRSEWAKRTTFQQTRILMRMLHSVPMNASFSEHFFPALDEKVPEAKAMFLDASRQTHALVSLVETLSMFFLRPLEYTKQLRKFAGLHFHMCVTQSMIHFFGSTFLATLKVHLHLEEKSDEWLAIERHWRAAYGFVSADLFAEMLKTPDKENEIPKWVSQLADEYISCTQQTVQLLTGLKEEEAFVEAFYSKFFELSPTSARKFTSATHQTKSLLAAIKDIADLKPSKMRRSLRQIAKVHRARDISPKECVMFARALRMVFKNNLGEQYTDQMDYRWKQFLECACQYITENQETTIFVEGADVEESDDDEGKTIGNGEENEVVDIDGAGRIRVRPSTPLDVGSRARLNPRDFEFLSQIFPEGKLNSPADLAEFFPFVHRCPIQKRLRVLTQYYMMFYSHPMVLRELLKQNSWKLWILPICPAPESLDASALDARTRLMDYVMLMLAEVFSFFFHNFDENEGVIPKTETEEAVTFDFERRGKDATMCDFLLDATSYISLLYPREVASKTLTAFVNKIGSWNAIRPSWAIPAVTDLEWPNFFSAIGAVEEFLFFSKRKALLQKEREFTLGTGPVFGEIALVDATCKLLAKLKFDRWNDMPENEAKVAKLQLSYQARGRQEEIFFNGVREFFMSCAGGPGSTSLPGFISLLLGRKQVYGTKPQIEKVVVRFLEGGGPSRGLTKSNSLVFLRT